MFGLKMKSGIEKIFLKFLHAEAIFFLFISLTNFEENHKFSNKNNHLLPAWRKIGNIFFTVCTWPNWPVGAKILPRFQFEGKTDVWISQVRRVKRWLNLIVKVYFYFSPIFKTMHEINVLNFCHQVKEWSRLFFWRWDPIDNTF